MASDPITSWQIDGETVETLTGFFLFVCLFVLGGGGAPKSMQAVTAAMKLRHLLFGIKAMINLDSILKSRDITFPVKVCLVKAMISPVILYRCESDYKEG